MIELATGNLLEADAEALVNTVNTVGVMGKGIALQFKQAFPANYAAYEKACRKEEVKPGTMFVFTTEQLTNPKYIINFPTKRHWKGHSRIEDIEAGLADLIRVVQEYNIRSIAIPPLGCGNGGLNWSDVRPLIDSAFSTLPDVQVLLYAPGATPEPERMSIGTKRPTMTPGRAAIVGLLYQYAMPGYRLSLLEVQKLAYFLQVLGEPLKLKYTKGRYGPYAENLEHVLQRMEGHFIRGYGDRSKDSPIRLLPDVIEEAHSVLNKDQKTYERLEHVSKLIEGFETPYGLELLATIHWLAQENPEVKDKYDAAIQGVHGWNEQKKKFPPVHIKIAWFRLLRDRML